MHHPFLHTRTLIALAVGALLLTAAGQIVRADATPPSAIPPAAAPAAPREGNHYQGEVTSIDATAKTFVIQTRFSETPLTVKTDDETKVEAIKNVGLASLKVGDHVLAQGEVSPDQATVTARQIRLLPADAKGKKDVTKRGASGTIATITPALTLTLDDGKTITVATGDRVRVMAPQDASFSDLAVGNQVEVRGTSDGTAFSATAVSITAPKTHRRRPAADATAPAADVPAAAPDATPAAPVKPMPDPLAKP